MTNIDLKGRIAGIDLLNKYFGLLNVEERLILLYEIFEQKEVLVTSSFGTDSALLLHAISRVKPSQKIHFIDTGFHFPETYEYKKHLTEVFGLDVEDVGPSSEFYELSAKYRLWEKHPDTCCFLNKVQLLEKLKSHHRVWVSGVMGHQTAYRSQLKYFATSDSLHTILKCCPLLDLDDKTAAQYKQKYQLPPHPLACQGYSSVGCQNCTVKGDGRSGRWPGHEKTECGLHVDYKGEN